MLTDAPPRKANRAGFLESDRIRALDLPQDVGLLAIAQSVESPMKAGTTADVRRACAEFGQPPLPKRTATSLVCAALLRQLAVEIKVRGQVIRTSQGINCAAFFLRRRFRIEPLETKKRLRLLGAVLVSGSSDDARSCRLWHGSSQARLRLTDDLLIVIGNDPLHIDACAFDPRFVRQSLELKLNLFSLLGRQEGDGKSGGFACGGLNFHRVWV